MPKKSTKRRRKTVNTLINRSKVKTIKASGKSKIKIAKQKQNNKQTVNVKVSAPRQAPFNPAMFRSSAPSIIIQNPNPQYDRYRNDEQPYRGLSQNAPQNPPQNPPNFNNPPGPPTAPNGVRIPLNITIPPNPDNLFRARPIRQPGPLSIGIPPDDNRFPARPITQPGPLTIGIPPDVDHMFPARPIPGRRPLPIRIRIPQNDHNPSPISIAPPSFDDVSNPDGPPAPFSPRPNTDINIFSPRPGRPSVPTAPVEPIQPGPRALSRSSSIMFTPTSERPSRSASSVYLTPQSERPSRSASISVSPQSERPSRSASISVSPQSERPSRTPSSMSFTPTSEKPSLSTSMTFTPTSEKPSKSTSMSVSSISGIPVQPVPPVPPPRVESLPKTPQRPLMPEENIQLGRLRRALASLTTERDKRISNNRPEDAGTMKAIEELSRQIRLIDGISTPKRPARQTSSDSPDTPEPKPKPKKTSSDSPDTPEPKPKPKKTSSDSSDTSEPKPKPKPKIPKRAPKDTTPAVKQKGDAKLGQKKSKQDPTGTKPRKLNLSEQRKIQDKKAFDKTARNPNEKAEQTEKMLAFHRSRRGRRDFVAREIHQPTPSQLSRMADGRSDSSFEFGMML
jgi:hypothetical protein